MGVGIRQYEANPVTSDSDDESKINIAESRALKCKPGATVGYRGRGSSGVGGQPWRYSTPIRPPMGRGAGLFRPSYSYSNMPFARGGFSKPINMPAPGPCYACGESTHFRKNCPYVQAQISGGAGNQSQSGK